jgi:hypothetical protein
MKITINTNTGRKRIHLADNTKAFIQEDPNKIRVVQVDENERQHGILFDTKMILELADYIRSQEANNDGK